MGRRSLGITRIADTLITLSVGGVYGDQIVSFGSWEDGILKVASGLRREYFDKELLTTELVMRKFTPSSNGSWARDVEIIMENISPDGFEENRKEVKNNMLTALLPRSH